MFVTDIARATGRRSARPTPKPSGAVRPATSMVEVRALIEPWMRGRSRPTRWSGDAARRPAPRRARARRLRPSAMMASSGRSARSAWFAKGAGILSVTALVLPWLACGPSGRGSAAGGGRPRRRRRHRLRLQRPRGARAHRGRDVGVAGARGSRRPTLDARATRWRVDRLAHRRPRAPRADLRFSMRDDAEAEAFLRRIGKDPSEPPGVVPRAAGVPQRARAWMVSARRGRGHGHAGAGVPPTGRGRTRRPRRWRSSRRPSSASAGILRPSLDLEVGANGVLDRTRWRGRFSLVARRLRRSGGRLGRLRPHDGTRRTVWCDPTPPSTWRCTRPDAKPDAWRRAAAADPHRPDLAGAPSRIGGPTSRRFSRRRAGPREQTVDRARLEALAADPPPAR